MPNYAAGSAGAIHIVLQGKGGVGKSFVALHLAQYFADRGRLVEASPAPSDPFEPLVEEFCERLRRRRGSVSE